MTANATRRLIAALPGIIDRVRSGDRLELCAAKLEQHREALLAEMETPTARVPVFSADGRYVKFVDAAPSDAEIEAWECSVRGIPIVDPETKHTIGYQLHDEHIREARRLMRRARPDDPPSNAAIETWLAQFDDAMLSLDHSWGLPDRDECKPFGVSEKHGAVRAQVNAAVDLMMRRARATAPVSLIEAARAIAGNDIREDGIVPSWKKVDGDKLVALHMALAAAEPDAEAAALRATVDNAWAALREAGVEAGTVQEGVRELAKRAEKAEQQRDALFHECEALRSKTPPCIDCDAAKAEVARLSAELAKKDALVKQLEADIAECHRRSSHRNRCLIRVEELLDGAESNGTEAEEIQSAAEKIHRLLAELARAQHQVSGCCPQSEGLAREAERLRAAGDEKLRRLREWIPDASCPNELSPKPEHLVDASELTDEIDRLLAEPATQEPQEREGDDVLRAWLRTNGSKVTGSLTQWVGLMANTMDELCRRELNRSTP